MTRHEEIVIGYSIWSADKNINGDAMLDIYEAGAKFADMYPKDNWRKTKDELPKGNEYMLVFTESDKFEIAHYSHTDFRWYTQHNTHINVIYWMPLPQPPEDNED